MRQKVLVDWPDRDWLSLRVQVCDHVLKMIKRAIHSSRTPSKLMGEGKKEGPGRTMSGGDSVLAIIMCILRIKCPSIWVVSPYS